LGWTAEKGPFSSQHLSRWNYTIPAMRYDVFEHALETNAYTESNNLFRFKEGILYSWDQNQQCTQCPHPNITYECVPSDWRVKDVVFVLGQKCAVFADDVEHTRNAQVASMDVIGTTPWLLNVLSYDQYENVVEAVQIQNFLQGVIEDPHALDIPDFCRGAPQCPSAQHHARISPAKHLPVYMKRRLGWEE
jgi:hypothetical protein